MIRYDIPEPKLSPNFTIDDIHKIRSWNYERFKDSTAKERAEYDRKLSAAFVKKLGLTNVFWENGKRVIDEHLDD